MSDRRLAAVMATDMVGFTAMMGADQDSALQLLARSHETLKAIVSSHDGEWMDDSGDRSITAFPNALSAVECALQIQAELANEPQLKLRIGIDVGDIVISGGHVYGDAVNIVSFIERLADPDGLVITETVYESIQSHIDLNVIDLGDKLLKNIGHPVRLYAISGSSTGSKMGSRFSELVARRVPHITGAYLATGWALVEVVDWVAARGALDVRWTYAIFVGLQDELAKFARLDSTLKNAFMPIVKRSSGLKSGSAANNVPNQIPPYLVGGETGWFYTGTAYINSVPSALVENTSNGDGKYLTVGQVFKNSKVVKITPSTLVLSDLEGLTTVTFELIENRPIIDFPDASARMNEPMNPMSGPIGLSASKTQTNPTAKQNTQINTNNSTEPKLNEITNTINNTEQKTTNENSQ